MSRFTFWGDLFKFSDDVLNEHFVYDQNYSLKAKAKSADGKADYAIKFEQSKPDESGNSKNSAELKQKLRLHHAELETKIKSSGKVSCNAEFSADQIDDAFKGWSYNLISNLVSGATLDKSSFSSAFSFKNDQIDAKVETEHGKWTELDVEATFLPDKDQHIVVGGSASVDLGNTKLNNYEVGMVNRLDDHFSYGIKNWSKDMASFGNFSFHTLSQVNSQVKIASSIGYSLDSKALDATAGFSWTNGEGDWTWKSKIDSEGIWANSSKHQLNKNVFLVFSWALNNGTRSLLHSSPQPFGIALEAKF